MPSLSIDAEPYAWPHDGQLRAESTAMLIIDMQRDFCDPGGYVDSMGYDISSVRRIVPAIVGLRRQVREWGGHIIYTREGHRTDLSDLPALKGWRSHRAGAGIGTQGPMGRLLVRGEPGWEIISELSPAEGEPVIDKPGYGAFFATDLERILRSLGIQHLILTGVTTDVCVHSTLREAVDRSYECLVVSDACAATDTANHAAALRTAVSEGGIFGAVAASENIRLPANGKSKVSP